MPLEPDPDGGMLVGGVVVDHDVQFAARIGAGDLLEERQELLMAVPVGAGLGNLAGGYFQRGEQGRGAVPEVVEAGRLGVAGGRAAPAQSAPGPAAAVSRPRRAPPPSPVDADRARRRRGSCPPAADRWGT